MVATFDKLAKGKGDGAFLDVPCEAWGDDVRLLRLRGMKKAELIDKAAAIEKDDEGNPLDKEEAYEFAVALLAASIVDDEGTLQFGTPDRQHWLSGEIEAVSELCQPAVDFNGLGTGGDSVE